MVFAGANFPLPGKFPSLGLINNYEWVLCFMGFVFSSLLFGLLSFVAGCGGGFLDSMEGLAGEGLKMVASL